MIHMRKYTEKEESHDPHAEIRTVVLARGSTDHVRVHDD